MLVQQRLGRQDFGGFGGFFGGNAGLLGISELVRCIGSGSFANHLISSYLAKRFFAGDLVAPSPVACTPDSRQYQCRGASP